MYCYNCGKKFDKKVNFCPYCGVKQDIKDEKNIKETVDELYTKIKDFTIKEGKIVITHIEKEFNLTKDKAREYANKLKEEKNNKEDTDVKEASVVEDNTNAEETIKRTDKEIIYSTFAYLGPLALIPYFANKENNEFIKFHATQGMNLLISWILYSILKSVLSLVKVKKRVTIFTQVGIMYETPKIITIFLTILGLGILSLSIIGIINVFNGKEKKIPLLEKINIIK